MKYSQHGILKKITFLYFLLFQCVVAVPQQPILIKDFNAITPRTAGSIKDPGVDSVNTVNLNGVAFFVADDGIHGAELWKSDGTETGTQLVLDIIPPDSSGSINSNSLTPVNNTLFFTVTNGSDTDLWKSDGSPTGTMRVKKTQYTSVSRSGPKNLINLNGILFYIVESNLWKSDGTEGGTVLVTDNFPSDPGKFVKVNDTLFFSASSSLTGNELWKTDGTEEGTLLVKNIAPFSANSDPKHLTNVNGILFFSAYESASGRELWKSDGTAAGTIRLTDIRPGGAGSFPVNLINVDGSLFFTAHIRSRSIGLWKSDGTKIGTQFIEEINLGTAGGRFLTAVNGTLFFVKYDSDSSSNSLWKSDGTNAGTQLVKELLTQRAGYIANLTNVDNTLYYVATDVGGPELWTSDGTTVGTHQIKDIRKGSQGSFPRNLININGTLFFSASDGIHGHELWSSDGSSEGTVLVKDINLQEDKRNSTFASSPRLLTNYKGTLFFVANDGIQGDGLWKSDGTNTGTSLVSSNFSVLPHLTIGRSIPFSLVNLKDSLFFNAVNETYGSELWKSDGTSEGTTLIKDINPGSKGSVPIYLTTLGEKLFFFANDGINGSELWQSGGTEATTQLVKDIMPGPESSVAHNLININNSLLFQIKNRIDGSGLWKSDGTTSGTVKLKNIAIARHSFQKKINNLLFFTAGNALQATGNELWVSDGTSQGTKLLKAFNENRDTISIRFLTNFKNTLYFVVSNGRVNGSMLYQSDGTSMGTFPVPGIDSPVIHARNLIPTEDFLYFSESSIQFKTDGKVISVLDADKLLSHFPTNLNSYVLIDVINDVFYYLINYFTSPDVVPFIPDSELWQSDETGTDTFQLGPKNRNPNTILEIDRSLFYSTFNDLWTIPNHTPIANNDAYTLDINDSLTILPPGLLSNDTDPDNGSLSAILDSTPLHGTVDFNADGSFSYTPDPDYTGTDSLTYYVTNGEFDSKIAMVTLTILSENILGDFDSDKDMDKDDLTILKTRFGQAVSDSNNRYDLNKDGVINVLDFRKAIRMCTRPRCATF